VPTIYIHIHIHIYIYIWVCVYINIYIGLTCVYLLLPLGISGHAARACQPDGGAAERKHAGALRLRIRDARGAGTILLIVVKGSGKVLRRPRGSRPHDFDTLHMKLETVTKNETRNGYKNMYSQL